MEDQYNIVLGDKLSFFGVYDGHGGDKCSEWLNANLPQRVLGLDDPTDHNQLSECILKADADFISLSSNEHKQHGSTCCFAIVKDIGDDSWQVTVVNVGDSRTLIMRKDGVEFTACTTDHKPSLPDEQARIEAAGMYVFFL
jgi:serine/threonine protein phosphatase PrpC